ncbi:DMT family transporter [Albidovulum sp.]|uniref:DMT family transporter n=1 Tax=Albidovulum sp. TaxID=1872424 RepID=UPI001DF029C2|nr:DMT family transporter [Paracoccaceae bacterium]MCC0046021.1 DMT family transporter [Defluviimonas sp.]HPE27202.1 DMT family transporter [Albidovulum sp.]MCB2123192.1 DMT family transporter [Paracoccaceae bacterium]MCB2131852.1 DMT family transporter [Paracoccaceae bacterium]
MVITDNLRGSAMMAAAMCAFTLNDACMKAVTAELPLYQTIMLRGFLTLVALAILAPRLGGLRFRLSGDDRRTMLWRTVGEILATVFFLTALTKMPFANLSAIMQALPLAVTLGAAVVFGAPIGWRRLTAIAIGFFGVVMIVRPGLSGFDIWSLLGLASVLFVVVRDLATRRLSRDVSSVTVAFLAALAVALVGAAVVPFTGWQSVTPHQWALIAMASVFLIVGYLCVVMAMRVGEIAFVAPFRYTALVAALALGWLVFGELPDALTLAGAAVIVLTGIYTFHRERAAGVRDPVALARPLPRTPS